MRPGETLIEMAQRHVREGEAHVGKQRRLIQRLEDIDAPTDQAQALLQVFEIMLDEHRAGLDRIVQAQRAGQRDRTGAIIVDPELGVRRPT